MDELISIIDRIKDLKDIKTDTAVAELLGIGQSAFAERKRKGSIPYEELVNFSEREKISFDWLLTGAGPQRRRDQMGLLESRAAEGTERYGIAAGDDKILRIVELLVAAPEPEKELILELLIARSKAREAWNKLKP